MLKKATLVKLLSLVFIVLPQLVAASEPEYAGLVVTWKGEVYLYREGEAKRIRVEDTTALRAGDIVTTERGSAVKLLLADDTVLALGEEGSLCVDSVELSPKTRRLTVRLVSGLMRVVVGRYFIEDSLIEVKTQGAAIRAEGTDFVVNPLEDAIEVAALDGTVEVESLKGGTGVVRLSKGYMTQVGPSGVPTSSYRVPLHYMEELLAKTDVPVNMAAILKAEGCKDCHRAVYLESLPYAHPDVYISCKKCHIKSVDNTMELTFRGGSGENLLFLELKEEGIPYIVRLEGMDEKGGSLDGGHIRVVPERDGRVLEDSATPPEVESPEPVEVRAGVFYSVRVEWTTDRPTRSYIEYGRTRRFGNLTPMSGHYSTEHSATIDRLKRGKRYYLRAVAEDAFGRKSYSEVVSIKVRKPYSHSKEADSARLEGLSLVKVGGRWAVSWRGEGIRAGAIRVEAVEPPRTPDKPHYPGLKSPEEAGTKACTDCHKGSIHLKASHPMVALSLQRSSGGLPLGSKGAMLCTTCHRGHGSVHPYILRKEENELCRSCHR